MKHSARLIASTLAAAAMFSGAVGSQQAPPVARTVKIAVFNRPPDGGTSNSVSLGVPGEIAAR